MLKAISNALLASASVPNSVLPPLTRQSFVEIHKSVGFALGLLKVIDDDAHFKATKVRRSVIVYTTPEERAAWAQAK